jgi:hypothetical protein
MAVSKDMLLLELPPYRDEWVVRKKNQRVKDIIRYTLEAYPRFESDYDRIGYFFKGATVADTCDKLYNFCTQNIQYVEEGVDWQSIERPAGILTRGYCDCKGYANFIGGCLGAMNRTTGAGIDWAYCFASYKIEQRTPYHVYVIVYTPDGEIWIDPTPGANGLTPEWMIIEKADRTMPLMENIGSLMENVGRVNAAGELVYDAAGAIGKNTSAAATTAGVAAFATSALTGNFVGAVLAVLPLITTWLSNYTYTDGDYALGEIFLNRVMNKATTNRWDTPDSVVPIAWLYMSTLFGIPIAVNTDFDNIQTGTLDAYLAGRPNQRGFVTQAQVTRAQQLLSMMGARTSQLVPQWPVTAFSLLPYVGPIPDPRIAGQTFTGQLPNGQQVVNGIPVTDATSGSDVTTLDAGGNVVNPITGAAPTAAGASPATGSSMAIPLLIAAAALALWWFTENE